MLRSDGSIYIHCDDTAVHYLKELMDAIFGRKNFRNEIVWERTRGISSISKNFRRVSDRILRYTKSTDFTFGNLYKDFSAEYINKQFNKKDDRGFYQSSSILASGRRNGDTGKVWRGIDPNQQGRQGMHWVTTRAKLDAYEKEGKIYWPKKKGGVPRLKIYVEEAKGILISDIWTDVGFIESNSHESLGYPTQKPLSL